MSLDRFNQLAKKWDSKPERVEGALCFVDEIFKTIKEDASNFNTLDYGCGSGLVSFALMEQVKTVTGMDFSTGMIDVYNQKIKSLKFNNISSLLHDINNQELDFNTYDLAVTNMTMHHIKDTNIFIKKLSSSLKPNGYLCIADLEIEDGTFHSCNDGVEHFGFNINNIEKLYKDNNLKNIIVKQLQVINKPNNNFSVFIAIGQKI